MAGNMQMRGIGVRYTADISDFTMKMNNVKAQMKEVAAESKKMGQKMNESFDLEGIGAGLLAFGSTLGLVIGKAIRAAIDDQETRAKITARTGVSRAEGTELSDIVRDQRRKGMETDGENRIEEAVVASKQILGLDPKQIKEIIDPMAQMLKIFPEIDPKELVLSANNVAEAQGISIKEAIETLYDRSVATGDPTEALEVSKEYEIHAAQMGLDEKDFTQLLRHGIESGVYQPNTVGDLIKEANISWSEANQEQAQAVQLLGLNVQEFFENVRKGGSSRRKAYEDVMKKLQETNDLARKEYAVQTLFGSQGEDVSMNFFDKPVKKNIKQTQKDDDLETAWKNYDAMSPKQTFDELKGAMNDLGVTIGRHLLPAVIATTKWLTDLINDINTFAKAHPIFTKTVAWLMVIISTLSILGGIVLMYKGAKALKNMGSAMGAAGAGKKGKGGKGKGASVSIDPSSLDLKKAKRVPKAPSGMPKTVRRLARPAKAVVDVAPKVSGWSKAFGFIKNWGGKIFSIFRASGGRFMVFSKLGIAGLLLWAIIEIVAFLVKMNGGFKKTFNDFLDLLMLPVELVGKAFSVFMDLLGGIKDGFVGVVDWLSDKFAALAEYLAIPFTKVWDWIQWIWDKLGEVYDMFKSAIPDALEFLGKKIKSVFKMLTSKLANLPVVKQILELAGIEVDDKKQKTAAKNVQKDATKNASTTNNTKVSDNSQINLTFNSNQPVSQQEVRSAMTEAERYKRDQKRTI